MKVNGAPRRCRFGKKNNTSGSRNRRSACALPHEWLVGKVKVPRGPRFEWIWKSRLAGAYPVPFARAVAKQLALAAPSDGRRDVDKQEPVVHFFWAKSLSVKLRCDVATPFADHLPEPAATEWEDAVDYAIEGPSRQRRLDAIARASTALPRRASGSSGSHARGTPARRGRAT